MADKRPSRSTLPGNPEDIRQRERNEFFRRPPCDRCEGTGNELFSMYRRCSKCGGTGIEPIKLKPNEAHIGAPGMIRADLKILSVTLAAYLAEYGIPELDDQNEPTEATMTVDEVLGHLRASLGGEE